MTRYIVTDSTAYLDQSYLENGSIRVVPLNVNLEGEVFKEGEHYTNREYFSILRKRPIYPQTSQPPAGEFLQCFESFEPGDEALVLLISGGISGSILSAQVAREMLDAERAARVHIVETNITAGGLMAVVDYARELLDTGVPIDKAVAEIEDIARRVQLFFVVEDLEYLVRGGRVGHWSRVVANTLKIKPVLFFQKGKIEVYQKIRTKHKALDHIYELTREQAPGMRRLSVMHVDCPEELEQFAARLRPHYQGELLFCDLGPVIGSHVGPGTIGVSWF